jgi:uncharacterized protein with von Willebrand factor type A (vWA) domain
MATVAAAFGARLRAAGIPATPERAARFAAAVGLGRPATVPALYWLARVTLVDRPDQFDAFDREFAAVFGGVTDVAERRGDPTAPALPPHTWPGPRVRALRGSAPTDVPVPAGEPTPEAGSSRDAAAQPSAQLTASIEERLGHKDFAGYTPEELAVLHRLVAELRIAAPLRRARRTVGAVSGRGLDVRRTLRRAHRTGGDPVRREFRRRRQRPRPIVLIADVSGSMDPYARVYLQLLQGAVRGARAEAFVMATRLTRLTRTLATGRPDDALARAAAAAQDWSGGTRIGESLKAFLDGYGRRGMARGAVVVIVSDGWERADPAVLGEQMERLARLAHRVVWVNPRSAAERYQPLVGGMAAALPHIDVLLSGHSLHALDEVLAAIRG